jgi:hypothetical protein
MLQELEVTAPELFAGVRSTVFRCWDKPTIVSDFVLRWALAHGLAQMRTYRHRHVSTGDVDQEAQLHALAAEFGALDFFLHQRHHRRCTAGGPALATGSVGFAGHTAASF